ncbi:MAG: uroporphyrinogen decarboxylase family protein [Candidatus Latescibacterota bacterium]
MLAALEHRPPDRIPTFDSFWEEFRQQCIAELGLPADVDLAAHFGIDIRIAVADETPFPTRRQVLSDDGVRRVERDGWGRLVETVRGAFFYRELEAAVRRPADLDRLQFDSPQLDCRYADFERAVASWRDRHCVFCKTGGPYLRTTFLRGEVAFLTDIATDPPFARALADRVADHIIQIGLESLRRGNLYDTGLWIYDDMAGNRQPMMSPAAFERVFLPAYRRMVAAFRAAGAAHVVLHSDGNVAPLLDMLVDAGIDGLNPVEPRAGLHLPALKARYGGRLAYVGGMCNSVVLPQGPAEAIVHQARQVIQAGRAGGVAIGAHSIGPDIPVAHYLAYRRLVAQEGCYAAGGPALPGLA